MIKKINDYLMNVRAELAKVSWPTFEELISSTYVVIIGSVIFALFIFGVDNILQKIMTILLR